MSNFMAESKRWRQKAGKYPYNRKPLGAYGGSKSIIMNGSGATKKLPTGSLIDSHTDKTPLKKKNTMTNKKTNNGLATDLEFSKQRKNSLLIGGSKDDQSKRYHAMI